MTEYERLVLKACTRIEQCTDAQDLENLRIQYLGKKSIVSEHLRALGALPAAERAATGQAVNRLKETITDAIRRRRQTLQEIELQARLDSEWTDVTAPGERRDIGCTHPVTRVIEKVEELFSRIGFEVKEGPEAEDSFHNFEALNIPPQHPARAMHDTFYLDNDLLLRTHTSPVQIRVMLGEKAPLRIIVPGRVYRRDLDPTHSPMFHQIEGLVVDKIQAVSFARLKGVVNTFLREFFAGEAIQIRFRPSYFPFTEPSAEIDIRRGEEQAEWLEVMGCGMVHPNVLRAVGLDAECYAGYAFGMGVERLAMLKYGIDDMRLLFDNHLAFISQFRS